MKSSSNMKILVAVVGATAVFGCASDVGPPGHSEHPVSFSAGCGIVPLVPPGESVAFEMQVGDLDREYLLHLPPTYDPTQPAPLMLDFHGYTGVAAGEETYTGLSGHADERGYIVVYPQGTGFTFQDQLITSWNDLAGNASSGPAGPICTETADFYPPPPECGEPRPCVWASCHDDLGFIGQLLDKLEGELCIDLDRVYATGMSNGGMFVHQLGCSMPERFAAIAPVGGTLARGFSCTSEVPLSVMNIWGGRDIYVSQAGDVSSDGYYYESAAIAMGKWAEVEGCDESPIAYPTSQDGVADLSCTQYDNCSTGAELVHCVWDGAHDWPAVDGQSFGNEIIWEFFAKHTRSNYRSVSGEVAQGS